MRTEQYTPEFVIAALEASAGIVSAAALKLRITRQAVEAYMKRHPEIAEARAQIREANCDLAETKLLGGIKDGNMTSVIFYLKTQGKHRGYIEGREVSGPGGGPVPVDMPTIDVTKLTFEERKQFLALHRKATVMGDADVETAADDVQSR